MIIGIDASNIRAGGGVTHLLELLRAADPSYHGFSKVIVWSGKATLSRIDKRPWLVKSEHALLDNGLLYRTFWQRFCLAKAARAIGCDILFVPGGSYAGDFHPVVSMSRNMLPFDWRELRRYGWSRITLKLMLLRLTQTLTFRHSDGLIFLTHYACDEVMRVLKTINGSRTVVPHGINKRFISHPNEQLDLNCYSFEQPYRLFYVSGTEPYKHQWQVAEAVAQLRQAGLPLVLDLVGPATQPGMKRLQRTMERLDSAGEFIRYHGAIPYAELSFYYHQADGFVFASSCENMPNILLEAMAAGLPIACSHRGPMPEVLGDAGVYFDPERPTEIADAIKKLLINPDLRFRIASRAFEKAQDYSWARCANETFSYIRQIQQR